MCQAHQIEVACSSLYDVEAICIGDLMSILSDLST